MLLTAALIAPHPLSIHFISACVESLYLLALLSPKPQLLPFSIILG